MTAEDGKVITAVVKEKEEARREHQAALNQGLMTGLVEHVTDDSKHPCVLLLYWENTYFVVVFSISLGALPGQQMISCKLTVSLSMSILIHKDTI